MLKIFQFIVLIAVFDKIFALRECFCYIIFYVYCNFHLAANDIEKCRISDEKCLLKSSNIVLKKYYGGDF